MGKVFRNGNSLAVTLPKTYAHQLNITQGSTVVWDKSSRGLSLQAQPQKKVKAPGVDQKFAKMVDEFIIEHEDVLKELSNR